MAYVERRLLHRTASLTPSGCSEMRRGHYASTPTMKFPRLSTDMLCRASSSAATHMHLNANTRSCVIFAALTCSPMASRCYGIGVPFRWSGSTQRPSWSHNISDRLTSKDQRPAVIVDEYGMCSGEPLHDSGSRRHSRRSHAYLGVMAEAACCQCYDELPYANPVHHA